MIRVFLFALLCSTASFASAQTWEELNDKFEEYYNKGDHGTALEYGKKALETAQSQFGRNDSSYSLSLNGLGALYRDMGQYDRALAPLLESVEITKKIFGTGHLQYGMQLQNLASLYKYINNYDKAVPAYLTSLNIVENSLGKNHFYYGILLNNLGQLYTEDRQYDKAVAILTEAIELQRKSGLKDNAHYGVALSNLAMAYCGLNQHENALPLRMEAAKIIEKSLGKNHYKYFVAQNNLAHEYSWMGEYAKALPLCLEAEENIEKTLGKEHDLYVASICNLTNIYVNINNYDKALGTLTEAVRIRSHMTTDLFPFLSERGKISFMKKMQGEMEYPYSLALKVQDHYPEIAGLNYTSQLALKGMVLSGTRLFLENIKNSTDTAIASKASQWQDARKQLAHQYGLPIARRSANVDSLEKIADELEGELARSSVEFAQATRKVEWQDVQASLAANEAAIEFVHFRYYDPDPTDSTFYAAMLLRPGYEYPKYVFLFEQRQLKQHLQKSASDNDKTFITRVYGDTALYNLVWRPMDSLLDGVDKIYYAPSGMLHSVSFTAMSAGKDEYLSQQYDLVQLGTTRTLATDMPQPQYASITAFGGIEYAYDSTHKESQYEAPLLALNDVPGYDQLRSSRGDGWSFLPGSAEEVKAIAGLFKGTKTTAAIKTGAEATEEDFKALSGNSPKVLHISTHGFFFPDIEQSKDELMRSGEATFKYMENPLFRSGLAFAGSNYALVHGYNPHEQEDGILTAYEISNMDLSNTDLVVLSACETGLGEIKGSEGVYGLQRAFQMAGVEYIIMSLWKIPDKQTKILMERFYSNWLDGMGIRRAFREAQQHMSKTYDPFYWAGFVLVGGGKEPVASEGNNRMVLYGISGMLLIIISILFLRRKLS